MSRRRGRHPPGAPKVGAGTVAAQLLDVVKALAADQLGLRERQQQLATRHPARTDFDRRSAALPGKLPVDQPDKPQRSRERPDHRESSERGEALIIGAKGDPSDPFGTVTAVHLQGELQSASWTGFATPTIPAPPDGKPRSQRGFLLQAPLSALTTRRAAPRYSRI